MPSFEFTIVIAILVSQVSPIKLLENPEETSTITLTTDVAENDGDQELNVQLMVVDVSDNVWATLNDHPDTETSSAALQTHLVASRGIPSVANVDEIQTSFSLGISTAAGVEESQWTVFKAANEGNADDHSLVSIEKFCVDEDDGKEKANTEGDVPFEELPIINATGLNMKYSCVVCRMEFADRGRYRHHYMIHTGEKPYACLTCPYRARQVGCLNRHIKQRHFLRDKKRKPYTRKEHTV